MVLLLWLLERASVLRVLLNRQRDQLFNQLLAGRLKKGWVLNLVLWQREKLAHKLEGTSVEHLGLLLEDLQEA